MADFERLTRDFFWSHLFCFTTAGPREQNQVKKRLSSVCDQYVALEAANMLKRPTAHIYPGTSEELLADAKRQCLEILSTLQEEPRSSSQDRTPSAKVAGKNQSKVIFVALGLTIAVAALVYWLIR